MTGRGLTLAATLSCAAGCAAVETGAPGRPANLLMVTIDTLRSDHCSAYGYGRPTTPRMERLGQGGALFSEAYAPAPTTGPSHASLLTGLDPQTHGVLRNGYVLPRDQVSLAEILAGGGHRTAAIVSSYPLKGKFGYDQGFQLYDDAFSAAHASIPHPRWDGQPLGVPYDRRADETTDRALGFLAAARGAGRPFFLWVHYFDPHSPYDPPDGYRAEWLGSSATGERDVAAYDAEVRFTDDQIGRLLDGLDAGGLSQRTLVVVTSDHGEGLGQHGEKEHGAVVYEEAVRVPLVMRGPGIVHAGLRVRSPVSLLDVAPTVLELMGLVPPVPHAGRSLAPLLRAAADGDGQRAIFLQSEYQDGPRMFGVRKGRWKYVERRRQGRRIAREMYDLVQDAGERMDVIGRGADIGDRLAADIATWRKAVRTEVPQAIPIEDIEALRTLGYVR